MSCHEFVWNLLSQAQLKGLNAQYLNSLHVFYLSNKYNRRHKQEGIMGVFVFSVEQQPRLMKICVTQAEHFNNVNLGSVGS